MSAPERVRWACPEWAEQYAALVAALQAGEEPAPEAAPLVFRRQRPGHSPGPPGSGGPGVPE